MKGIELKRNRSHETVHIIKTLSYTFHQFLEFFTFDPPPWTGAGCLQPP